MPLVRLTTGTHGRRYCAASASTVAEAVRRDGHHHDVGDGDRLLDASWLPAAASGSWKSAR